VNVRLSRSSPQAAAAVARRWNAVAGAVHFGPGAFHRAHQAWYFDRLLERDPRWAITGVSLKSPGVRDALAPQDNLYVLAELDSTTTFNVISSVTGILVAEQQRELVLQRLAAPETGWVSATVTEKGYCLDARGELDAAHPDIIHDLANPRQIHSFIGYLAEGLRRRRAAGLAPPVIVSCDNLADNGRLLKRAVVQFAGELDRELARWIDAEAAFPRTMVDSITPATDGALRQRIRDELKVDDAWPIQRERFTQWVIEDILPAGAADLASVGAEITNDVGGYERAKLRLLNGAHSSLAYLGLLRGHETVADAMADADLAGFVEALMREHIAPHVRAPASLDVPGYIAAVLDRFRNPAIRHLLSQIAWDGSKKLPFRLLDTILDARAAGRPIDALCSPLAAWFAFIRRQAKASVAIVDPLQAQLTATGVACDGPPEADVARFLDIAGVFPEGLAKDDAFRRSLTQGYAALLR
jgi:fructuronate reductase